MKVRVKVKAWVVHQDNSKCSRANAAPRQRQTLAMAACSRFRSSAILTFVTSMEARIASANASGLSTKKLPNRVAYGWGEEQSAG